MCKKVEIPQLGAMLVALFYIVARFGFCDPRTFIPNTDYYVPGQGPSVALSDATVGQKSTISFTFFSANGQREEQTLGDEVARNSSFYL